jgi:uncharacterized protein (DUF433 family)
VAKELEQEALLAPRYSIAEAAHLIPGLSRTTLRSWVLGRHYPVKGGKAFFEPILRLPEPGEPMLSFINLVEAHILYGLRSNREISIPDLRTAIDYAERQHGIQHLLAHRDVRAAAGDLFLDRYGELVSLTKAGQLAMREVLHAYLRRLRHGKTGLAIRLSPILPWAPDRQDYVIDPTIAYGRPVIAKHGVPVEVVANRINGGESLDTLARDYGLEQDEIKTALAYSRAA